MHSDILILIKDQVDDDEAGVISAAIYRGAPSAMVTFNSTAKKVFLVKFDPKIDDSDKILKAARSVRPDAMMAGG